MADWSGYNSASRSTASVAQNEPSATSQWLAQENRLNSAPQSSGSTDSQGEGEGAGGGAAGGGGGGSPVTPTGQISTGYTNPTSYYYGSDFQQGQGSEAAVGAAGSAATDYAVGDAYETIARAYRDLLGREASAEEIWTQLKNQGWKYGDRWVGAAGLNYVLSTIANSEEAAAYRNRQQTPPPEPQPQPPPEPPVDPGPDEDFGVGAGGNTGGGGGGGGPVASTPTTTPAATGGGGSAGGAGRDWTAELNKIAGQFSQYDPYQFTQFTPPDQSALTSQVQNALSQALANSEWSPERVAQMKEIQKEQALAMAAQTGQQLGDTFAARGRGQSGLADASQRRLANATQSSILDAYRDVDLQAAQNRRNELLSTSAAIEQALSGEAGRAATNFATGLAGQSAQADENYRGFESQFAPYELALKQMLGQEGIGVDWGRISESGRQFDLSHQLALMDFAERIRQFNNRLGFDYTNMNYGAARSAAGL